MSLCRGFWALHVEYFFRCFNDVDLNYNYNSNHLLNHQIQIVLPDRLDRISAVPSADLHFGSTHPHQQRPRQAHLAVEVFAGDVHSGGRSVSRDVQDDRGDEEQSARD